MKRVIPPKINFIPLNTPETERNLRLAYSRVINKAWETMQRRMRLLGINYLNTTVIITIKPRTEQIRIMNSELFIEAKSSELYYGIT